MNYAIVSLILRKKFEYMYIYIWMYDVLFW